MNTNTRWTMLFAAVGGVAFASWLRRKLHGEKQAQAHKTELQEWENEGGNLAPSAAVPDILIIMR